MLSLNKADDCFLKGDIVMAKVCINCGKKIGLMVKEAPLDLCAGQVLCSECSSSIRQKIGKLYGVKSLEEFNALKDEIIQESQKYNLYAKEAVEEKINSIYETASKIEIERYQAIPDEVKQRAAEKAQRAKEKQEAELALKKSVENHLLTTGYNFDGYAITKYVGILSGEVVLGTGFLSEFSASVSDLLGASSGAFEDKLDIAKKVAIEKLTVKSVENGGNAIIGIDFDYITFANNMIGVVANGTSVITEKIE